MNLANVIEDTSQQSLDTIAPANFSMVDYDKLESLVSQDYANEFLTFYGTYLCTGFAFATLLILITYGVFKAISFIHIKT